MVILFRLLFFILPFFYVFTIKSENSDYKRPKIVGLIAVHNEAAIIKQCLRSLAVYADAIVVLDDASSDNTLEIVAELKDECKIEKIITKAEWVRDERADKNALLYAGREVGGTHFILIDADEMFTANCSRDGWLRAKILDMMPGQIMTFPMMNLWGSLDYYRDDELCGPMHWKWKNITAVLCDDGLCNYNNNIVWGTSGTIHVERKPYNRVCNRANKEISVSDINFGLLHFKSINLEEVKVKKIWYMCLEYVNLNRHKGTDKSVFEKNAKIINDFYKKEFDSMLRENLAVKLSRCPLEWFDYQSFDRSCYLHLHDLRKNEVLQWISLYGKDYFKPLHIWDAEWLR